LREILGSRHCSAGELASKADGMVAGINPWTLHGCGLAVVTISRRRRGQRET